MGIKNEEDQELTGNLPDGTDENDFVIEVEDDTPPEDRGRKPLKHDALAIDDEALEVSQQVKRRIGELRHAAHDERRAREAAERREAEAVTLAKQNMAEIKKLRQQLQYGEANFAKLTKSKAESEVAKARQDYREAYDSGDPDRVAEAAEKLAAAVTEAQNAGHWVASAQQQAEIALQSEKDNVDSDQDTRQATSSVQRQQAQKPDPRAVEWAQANSGWYGVDSEMTALAYGVHEKLVKAGINPVLDADRYYEEIDATMRKRFPDYDWGEDEQDEGTQPRRQVKTTSAPRTAVAPVTRTASGQGNPQRVKLTKSQVELAERLGLTKEQYAAELLKSQQGA